MNFMLGNKEPSHRAAIAEGVLATLIWGSTLAIVKLGLEYLGPLTLASIRFLLTFLLLLPFIPRNGASICHFPSPLWLPLIHICLRANVVGNGVLYWGLKYIPATTSALIFHLGRSALVLLIGSLQLKEIPTRLQMVGVVFGLMGIVLFYSHGFFFEEPLRIGLTTVGPVGFALFSILGREVAKYQLVNIISLTAIPLGFGGGILLFITLLVEGLPSISAMGWGIVILRAVLHTALAYTLYSHALQAVTALEMSIILGLAPLVMVLFSWVLLDESLSIVRMIGMVIVIIGVILVQWRRHNPEALI